jgi:hypothetical protein
VKHGGRAADQSCRAPAEQHCTPGVLLPSRLQHAKDVDASVEPLQHLPIHQSGHLTVVKAETDQLRAGQDTCLALCPCNRGSRNWFGEVHARTFRILCAVVRRRAEAVGNCRRRLCTTTAAGMWVPSPVFGSKDTRSLFRPSPGAVSGPDVKRILPTQVETRRP